jgi:hypothetical protein
MPFYSQQQPRVSLLNVLCFQTKRFKQTNNQRRKICPFRMLIATLAVAQHRTAYRQCDLNIPTHRSNIPHYFYRSSFMYEPIYTWLCRSRWPHGLRRGSAAAHLLELWVRIPPGASMYLCLVSVVCCQVEVSASGWSLVQRNPTDCGLSEYDREASILKRSWPTRACFTKKTWSLRNLWGRNVSWPSWETPWESCVAAKPVISVAVQFVNSRGVNTGCCYCKHEKSNS